jgi:hypothetical protein
MREALDPYDRKTTFLIHGGAKGGDAMAHRLWREMGFVTEPHVVRPEYDYWVAKIGKPAGYKVAPTKRNGLMVDGKLTEEGDVDASLIPDLVLAFYITKDCSGGTWDCHQKALKAKILVIHHHDC